MTKPLFCVEAKFGASAVFALAALLAVEVAVSSPNISSNSSTSMGAGVVTTSNHKLFNSWAERTSEKISHEKRIDTSLGFSLVQNMPFIFTRGTILGMGGSCTPGTNIRTFDQRVVIAQDEATY